VIAMKVKVISGSIRHNGQEYSAGKTIENLSENDVRRLINLGVALPLQPVKEPEKAEKPGKETVNAPEIPDVSAKTINEIKKRISTITDVKVIKAMLKNEENSPTTRVGAVKALEERVREIES